MKIEKNIPITKSWASKKPSPRIEILGKMEIGDSILVPINKVSSWRTLTFNMNIKIASRKISNTKARIWRMN